jgi:tetratricopeptide (TPR) repeat protein
MRFIVVLMLLISTVGFAQKKKKDKDKEPAPTQQQQVPAPAQTPAQPAPDSVQVPSASMILTEHYMRKYAAAARWNDLEVAKSALYDVIIENPGNDSLIFTLAYYYYDEQKFASSLLVTQDLLTRDPKNGTYLEMAASAAQQLGANDKALQHYESLFLLTNNIRALYQIAFLQYGMNRFSECTNNINIILGKPEAATEKVGFNDAKGVPKEYPLKVSILNLKGMVLMAQKDKVGARKAFTEALALAPDFVPAKENLEKAK